MATERAIEEFALRLLDIAYEGDLIGFEELFFEYKNMYGSMPWPQFERYVREAQEMGLFNVANGVPDIPELHERKYAVGIEQPLSKRALKRRKGKPFFAYYTRLNRATILPGLERLKDKFGIDLLRNANQELFDAIVRNQIFLLRLQGTVRDEIIDLLNKTERDLAEQIVRRLIRHKGPATLGTRKLQLLEKYIKTQRAKTFADVTATWVQSAVDVANNEAATAASFIKTASPVVVELSLPTASQLKGIVNSNPFEGRTLKQWADSLEKQDTQRILDQIRIGLVQGEDSRVIARRIVGSARLNGRDGATQITRRHAEAITRTAILHIANATREELYLENSNIIDRERYVATLDSRTTPICRSLDGKIYPLGKGPKPPIHWNCRSIRIPFFDGEALGNRPARAFTQKQLVREFSAQNGLGKLTRRSKLPRGYKGLYDEFERRRIRELTSIVPSNVDYTTWLSRQTVQFQDDILGPTRGKLFRKGGLELDKFVDASGDNFTLGDLARKHREAFIAAGLEPEDFF